MLRKLNIKKHKKTIEKIAVKLHYYNSWVMMLFFPIFMILGMKEFFENTDLQKDPIVFTTINIMTYIGPFLPFLALIGLTFFPSLTKISKWIDKDD